jgi:hypothetical protein
LLLAITIATGSPQVVCTVTAYAWHMTDMGHCLLVVAFASDS